MISHDIINRFYPTSVNILAEPEAVHTTTSLLELRIQQVLGGSGGAPRSRRCYKRGYGQLAAKNIRIEMKSLDYVDCTYNIWTMCNIISYRPNCLLIIPLVLFHAAAGVSTAASCSQQKRCGRTLNQN